MGAVYGIVAREFVRFLRQRGRVLASIGRPFVWLVFAGGGFAAVFAGRNEIDYRVYMAPGLLGMVVMFGSLLAALSRSEEHTSELQSRLHLVCRLLLEKKKKKTKDRLDQQT